MNYKKHYDALIERGKHRSISGYKESHHIIPRCMGGDDTKENLVYLTPEEHYLAHQLLMKMYPNNYSLVKAAVMMIPNRPSNKLYGWIKRKFSEAQSLASSGKSNTQYDTQWIYNDKLKLSKKKYKTDVLEEGWVLGRKLNFDEKIYNCAYCGDKFVRNKLEVFCSNNCKKNKLDTGINTTINENLEFLISEFEKNKSIDKTLRNFGIPGTRVGNDYFSTLLKSRGYSILKRRNSAI